MPPQYPASRFRPSSFTAGSKKSSLLATISSRTKKIARPTSAPSLTALSATASSKTIAPAKKIVRPMPSSSLTLAAPSAAKPRAPSSSTIAPAAAAAKTSIPKKPARSAAPGYLAAANRAAESVHPTRRLTCGTAVCVRTKYVLVTGRCCLLIWLPARVVSSLDAYHCTVKYAAGLHAMFAGKVVRVSVDDVREAPHRAAAPPPRLT